MVSNRASPLHAQALAALRAARGQNPAATLGRHAGTETVGLRPLASIRLIGALHVLFPSVVQSNFESISHVPSESRKIPKNAKNPGMEAGGEPQESRKPHSGPQGSGAQAVGSAGDTQQARKGTKGRSKRAKKAGAGGGQRDTVDSQGELSGFARASRQRAERGLARRAVEREEGAAGLAERAVGWIAGKPGRSQRNGRSLSPRPTLKNIGVSIENRGGGC